MTDEETECRLTYKEGREINKKAQKPYLDRAVLLFGFGVAVFVTCLVMNWVISLVGAPHPSLDMLLINGDITQGLHDYMVAEIKKSSVLTGAIFTMIFIAGSFTMTLIGEIEGKKALEAENKKRASE